LNHTPRQNAKAIRYGKKEKVRIATVIEKAKKIRERKKGESREKEDDISRVWKKKGVVPLELDEKEKAEKKEKERFPRQLRRPRHSEERKEEEGKWLRRSEPGFKRKRRKERERGRGKGKKGKKITLVFSQCRRAVGMREGEKEREQTTWGFLRPHGRGEKTAKKKKKGELLVTDQWRFRERKGNT